MNAEHERVDAGRCVGGGKMAAGVVERYSGEFVLDTFDDW